MLLQLETLEFPPVRGDGFRRWREGDLLSWKCIMCILELFVDIQNSEAKSCLTNFDV